MVGRKPLADVLASENECRVELGGDHLISNRTDHAVSQLNAHCRNGRHGEYSAHSVTRHFRSIMSCDCDRSGFYKWVTPGIYGDRAIDLMEYLWPSLTTAIVVGSGPNGLCAAITLAQTGRSVLVVEANSYIGGGLHSAELTEPGFIHDVCSAVHPLAVATSFLPSLPLASHGLNGFNRICRSLIRSIPGIARCSILSERTGYVDRDGALHAPEQAYSRLMQPIVRTLAGDRV